MKTIEKLLFVVLIYMSSLSYGQDLFVNVIPVPVSCNGLADGSAMALPSGGTNPYSYLWDNGATTQTISGLSPGSYLLTVTDANGQIALNGTVILEPNSLEVFSYSEDGLCGENGSAGVDVSGGILPYSYLWQNGETSAEINDLVNGTYSVLITDNRDCTAEAQIEVMVDPAKLEFETDVIRPSCFGDTNGSIDVTITNGTPPYTYWWNNQLASQDQTNIGAGSYSVFIQDGNLCSAGVTIAVLDSEELTLQFINDSNALIGRVEGGTPPYKYKWSTGQTGTSVLTNIDPGTYGLTATDANGCFIVGEGNFLGPLDIQDVSELKSFELAPNPSKGKFHLEFSLDKEQNVGLEIYSSNGELIMKDVSKKLLNYSFLNSNLNTGLYFLKISLNDKIVRIEKLIVQ